MSIGIKYVFNFSLFPHIISKGYDNLALRTLDENLSVSQLFANSSLPSFALPYGCSVPALHLHDLSPPPPPPHRSQLLHAAKLSESFLQPLFGEHSILRPTIFLSPVVKTLLLKFWSQNDSHCLLLVIGSLSRRYQCWKYTFDIYEFKSLAILGFYR